MFDFISCLLNNLKPTTIAPETPVEIWVIKRYNTLFRCHVRDEAWESLNIKNLQIDHKEYGIGNPVIVVINDVKSIAFGTDRSEFERIYGNLPILSNEQAAKDRDLYAEYLRQSVAELEEIYNRIMNK